jgi:tRNA (cmo5U34)-methyltransferase
MAADPSRDSLYAEPQARVADFVFDERVAAVFPDMLNRSIPGYPTIIRMVGLLAGERAVPGGRCYDLGCSLGAAALAMARALPDQGTEVVAVDNSPAMIERAEALLAAEDPRPPIRFHCADILDFSLQPASMVVLNFTLQFIPPERREDLLRRIHAALLPGGVLVLSEKIAFEEPEFQGLFTAMHHQFKQDRGYSELEISQKRTALEKVLIPETLQAHRERLARVGFRSAASWFQCFNFVSLLALK